jgi:hypothetical protein
VQHTEAQTRHYQPLIALAMALIQKLLIGRFDAGAAAKIRRRPVLRQHVAV